MAASVTSAESAARFRNLYDLRRQYERALAKIMAPNESRRQLIVEVLGRYRLPCSRLKLLAAVREEYGDLHELTFLRDTKILCRRGKIDRRAEGFALVRRAA